VYQAFARNQDIESLIGTLRELPLVERESPVDGHEAVRPLSRDDLHLICFDFVWS
jgi:hypothetical protein